MSTVRKVNFQDVSNPQAAIDRVVSMDRLIELFERNKIKVTPRTIKKWMKIRRFPGRKFGTQYIFLLDEVLDWIKNNS